VSAASVVDEPYDLAVLGLDTTSSGGSLTSSDRSTQTQQWFLVVEPEQFGWISGGKMVQFPIKASAG